MKICILPDKLNWAYHAIALALKKYNPYTDVQIDIRHIKGNIKTIKKKYKKYDRFLVMGWQTYDAVNFLPKSKTLIGVHSFHSWDKRETTPEKSATPDGKLIKFLNKFLRVNVVSSRLFDAFDNAGLDKLNYTPNGVDLDLFEQKKIYVSNYNMFNKDFYVGYSGSKAHDWRKGTSEFIIPATKLAGAENKLAMLSTGSYIPLGLMPNFYQSLDCYVCASSSEGMSLSVLEAAATGLPIISTRCSGTDEMFVDKENCLLVDRDMRQIADKISYLKHNTEECVRIGSNIRKTVEDKFSWKERVIDWIDFIKE
jgi:glycosyltransferase involved in cell wall biosynthesis